MGLVKYFWAKVWCEGVKIEVVQASVMCYQPPKELIFVAITQTQSGPGPKEEARQGGRISHFYSQLLIDKISECYCVITIISVKVKPPPTFFHHMRKTSSFMSPKKGQFACNQGRGRGSWLSIFARDELCILVVVEFCILQRRIWDRG